MSLTIDSGKLLTLTDEEIVAQLDGTKELILHFRQLIKNVYEDESLAKERTILHEETQSKKEAQLKKLNIKPLKILLKVRRSIMNVLNSLPSPISSVESRHTHEKLKNLVLAIGDGDLAYTTYRWHRFSHNSEAPVIFEDRNYEKFLKDLKFSPELQKKIAVADEYKSIPLNLAENHHLTSEVQVILLGHNHPNVRYFLIENLTANSPEMMDAIMDLKGESGDIAKMHLVFTDRDLPNEILALIKKDKKLDLIYRSKTDSKAEMEMIEKAASTKDKTWMEYITNRTKLLSEGAVRMLHKLKKDDVRWNKNISKYSALVKELGLDNKD
jgi:hypothetical protein